MKKSVTIIISHYESLVFLRKCITQICKYSNENIDQKILIIDQSSDKTYHSVCEAFGLDDSVFIAKIPPLYSGYGIDWALRHLTINTDYICQLHADAFPISREWLHLPITLIEENNLAFTGVLQTICDRPMSIYPSPPDYKPFFAMAQCFNIGRTDVYKEMSMEAGFTRYHNRTHTGFSYKNDDWDKWAMPDYAARGSDDDIVAFCWEDNHREHNKLSLGMTGKIGIHGEESGYGVIVEDLLFHFGFHRESIGVMPQMGEKYGEWTRRINEGYTDELLDEMLTAARAQSFKPEDGRIFWDGKEKRATLAPHSINQRINELKQQ